MKLKGSGYFKSKVEIFGSKSDFQRILLFCLVHEIDYLDIENVSFTNDDKAALKILEEFGFTFEKSSNKLTLLRESQNHPNKINLGESGFLTRSLLAIFSFHFKDKIVLTGDGSILTRNFSHEINYLRKCGCEIESDGYLPITLKSGIKELKEFDASNSSQFLSGLLIANSKNFNSTICASSVTSKNYIDLTIDIAAKFGLIIENKSYQLFQTVERSEFSNRIKVDADWSSAVFWIVAALINGEAELLGLDKKSSHADKSLLYLLHKLKIEYSFKNEIFTITKQKLPNFEFDAIDSPDLIPILTLLAIYAEGDTVIKGIDRLTNKESNRKAVLINEFKKIGIEIIEESNSFIIKQQNIRSGKISSHNDHRIAMTFAIASLVSGKEIEIDNLECINKSYPNFLNDFNQAGGKVY